MLNFERTWRFDSPGKFPIEAVSEVFKLIGRIAAQANDKRQSVLEHFKSLKQSELLLSEGRNRPAVRW